MNGVHQCERKLIRRLTPIFADFLICVIRVDPCTKVIFTGVPHERSAHQVE